MTQLQCTKGDPEYGLKEQEVYNVVEESEQYGKKYVKVEGIDWFFDAARFRVPAKFKVGEKIRCINGKNSILNEGSIYTVLSVAYRGDRYWYRVEGLVGAEFAEKRFVVVKPAQLKGILKITDEEGNSSKFAVCSRYSYWDEVRLELRGPLDKDSQETTESRTD